MAQRKNRAESAPATPATETKEESQQSKPAKAEKEQKMTEQKNQPAPKAEEPKATEEQKNPATEPAEEPADRLARDAERRAFKPIFTKAESKIERVDNDLILTESVKVTQKEHILPKGVKSDKFESACALIAGKMLNIQSQRAISQQNKIDDKATKAQREKTEEEQSKHNALERQKETIKALTAEIGAEHSEVIVNSLADMLAYHWSGEILPINLDTLAIALQNNYKALHRGTLALAKDGKAELTEEESASIKALRDALVNTMSIYCVDSTWFDAFSLSASATDAVTFYELARTGYDKNGEPIFNWKADKDGKRKELSKHLTQWLLKKMKASAEE